MWILVVMSLMANSYVRYEFQELETLQLCRDAAIQIRNTTQYPNQVRMTCVKKATNAK